MAEETGIVMKLYDEMSPELKTISKYTKVFCKDMDELEDSMQAIARQQGVLVKRSAEYKKALAESNSKVNDAQKAYKKFKDEASKGALDAAIDEQTRLKQSLTDTESAIKANDAAFRGLMKSSADTAVEMRKRENRAGGGGIQGLKKSFAYSMLGPAVGQFADTFIESAIGQPKAALFSNVVSGAASGAEIAGLYGAIAGAGAGIISGRAQVFAAEDDAFKAYVQEQAEARIREREEGIASGSAIAAQRELDAIAFDRLLGDGAGREYLGRLRELAAGTAMSYSELTGMSRALAAGFGENTGRMLELLEGIGNVGAAVGADSGGMSNMAQALSRMESSNEANLEYLNMFQEQSVDVIGMLARAKGTDEAGIYSLISRGALGGREAVGIIESGLSAYGEAMDELSQTFSGLESVLTEARENMDAAYGEGFNEERKKGLEAETDFLSGESGAMIQKANRAMGAFRASLENDKEQYVRDAMQKALDDGAQAMLDSGDEEQIIEAGRMLMEAKTRGMNEYNASDGAQLLLESERIMIETIRNDADNNADYWDAGYKRGQWFSNGLIAALFDSWGGGDFEGDMGSPFERAVNTKFAMSPPGGKAAFGLNRVPYDGYAAILHEGERVMTAREARAMDAGAGSVINVSISGNRIGEGTSPAELASALAREIEIKLQAGVR
ncbi:MAG: tape measure protein [Candidatus Heteroscillospira sp.]